MISNAEITFWLIGGGFIPGIIWLIYFHLKNFDEPEAATLVLLSYIVGVFVALPVMLVSLFYTDNPFVSSVVLAPLVEEFFKFLTAYYFLFSQKGFKRPVHGLINGIAIALGFASIENGIYLYRAFHAGTFEATFIIRGILTVPGHALWSGIWAYSLGKYKFSLISKPRLTCAVIASMLAHSMFNFIVFLGNASMLASLIFNFMFLAVLAILTSINFNKSMTDLPT